MTDEYPAIQQEVKDILAREFQSYKGLDDHLIDLVATYYAASARDSKEVTLDEPEDVLYLYVALGVLKEQGKQL